MGRIGSVVLVVLGTTVPDFGRQTPAASAPRAGDDFVLAIQGPDRAPLPGAEVRFALGPSAAAPEGARAPSVPPVALVEELLASDSIVHPDSAGRVPIAWPRGHGLLVCASEGDRFDIGWFPADWRESRTASATQAPWEFRLEEGGGVVLLVVDPAGEIVEDARVSLRRGRRTAHASSSRLLVRLPPPSEGEPDEPIVAAVDALLPEPVERTLAPERRPTRPVVLSLPPTGSVEIEVREPNGRSWTGRSLITLCFPGASADESARRLEVPPRTCASVQLVDGRARFAHVAVAARGAELLVLVGNREDATTRVHAPTRAGERVRTTLFLPPADTGDR